MRLTKDDWWFGTRFFPCVGNVIIPIDSYFSEGWLNHQPENVDEFSTFFVLEMTLELYEFYFFHLKFCRSQQQNTGTWNIRESTDEELCEFDFWTTSCISIAQFAAFANYLCSALDAVSGFMSPATWSTPWKFAIVRPLCAMNGVIR